MYDLIEIENVKRSQLRMKCSVLKLYMFHRNFASTIILYTV